MDLTAAGKTFPPYEFRVERGKIKEFADAIGDPNPIYRDPDYARRPLGAIVAPPTLLRTFLYEPRTASEALKVKDWSYIVHGEQEFEYLAPVLAGDVLTGEERIVSITEKESRRAGKLHIGVIETVFTTSAARRCRSRGAPWSRPASASAIDRHAGAPGGASRNQWRRFDRARRCAAPRKRRGKPAERTQCPPSFDSIKIGDAPQPLVCGPLTRTDFVRYAGASLDLNPNHHDERLRATERQQDRVRHGHAGGRLLRPADDRLARRRGARAGCASASPRASGRTTS